MSDRITQALEERIAHLTEGEDPDVVAFVLAVLLKALVMRDTSTRSAVRIIRSGRLDNKIREAIAAYEDTLRA